MTNSNDNRTFTDVFPRKHRRFADRSLYATCEGLKSAGVSQEMIVQALFDYAIAEATGGPDYVFEESQSFLWRMHMMKDRIDALVRELEDAWGSDDAHDSSSA